MEGNEQHVKSRGKNPLERNEGNEELEQGYGQRIKRFDHRQTSIRVTWPAILY